MVGVLVALNVAVLAMLGVLLAASR